uniref:T9SS type A sorting domain-containing protein n=1 Tax=Flavobacterium sp. TaxID=239 RepID=UPI0025D807B1
ALTSTTALSTGNYYVSQTVNSIESARTTVAVTVNVTVAPTASNQVFCNSGTVANLVATGTALQWFTVTSGGSALTLTTALSTGNYYVSQTLNSCESTRTLVTVTINNNLTIDAGFYVPSQGLEGCTLGYWKNHTDRWCSAYRTCDRFGDVFTNAPARLANLTLLEALNLGGGGIYNLARQGVAALLNACGNDVNYAGYGDDAQSVIDAVNQAYEIGGTAPGTLGSQLDTFNNTGCPLGGTRATTATNCTAEADKTTPKMQVVLHPNPYTDSFNLEITTPSVDKVGVSIYDMMGKLLEKQEVNLEDVPALKVGNRYPSGVYNVIVTQGSEVKTLRVIKR